MDPFQRFKEANKRHDAAETAPKGYSIVPTIAFAQPVQVNALAASYNTRFVFTGGEDGLVKKYDFHASVNGLGMQVSQRQMQIDTITKSGVLCAFWENEQPLLKSEYKLDPDGTYLPQISPVFSLQAQCQALWVCAGMQSGDICFQSTTYGDIGKCIAVLSQHTKPVADMHLNSLETALLSGSWDKSVALWDLNRTRPVHVYSDLNGQISAVRWQPVDGPALIQQQEDEMDSLFGSDDDSNNNEIDDAITTEIMENSIEKGGESGDNDATGAEKTGKVQESAAPAKQDVFLASTINGVLYLLDQRQPLPASSLTNSQAPPWAMSACWSTDGAQMFIGRRNSAVDVYDIRKLDAPTRVLRFPNNSGPVSCVEVLPNNAGVLCASFDNIRLYELESQKKTPFVIVPGHHGSTVSRMLVDSSNKCFVSACGGRGWADTQVDYVLGYEITSEA